MAIPYCWNSLREDNQSGSVEGGVWARARLSPGHLSYLRSLPLLLRQPTPGEGVLALVHATPWSVEEIVRYDSPEEVARRMLREAQATVVVCGHIHSAYQWAVADGLLVSVGG